MLKKTLTYTNIDGAKVTEDFYFNMTKAELMEMELSAEDGGFKEHLERIVKSGKGKDIIAAFKEILKAAYGERKDGRFVKSPEAFDAFAASEAYSDLFFELVTDAKKSAEFINAIMPAELLAEVEKAKEGPKEILVPEDTISENLAAHLESDGPSDDELYAALGIEERKTNGLTDGQILLLSPSRLKEQPREVLLRAYQLKNQK
jgi:hypothetical protein